MQKIPMICVKKHHNLNSSQKGKSSEMEILKL